MDVSNDSSEIALLDVFNKSVEDAELSTSISVHIPALNCLTVDTAGRCLEIESVPENMQYALMKLLV